MEILGDKLTFQEQSKINCFFDLSAKNKNKETFGQRISKLDAIAILTKRALHQDVIESIRQADDLEIRAFAKSWQTPEETTLYVFNLR
ncbi:hypothetical protein AWB71_06003 [Caballeronia peredens]|nr:hypothetical protein AWB71_06003 [Caballeronia peredens]